MAEEGNGRFVRRSECERVMLGLEKRVEGLERNMEKLAASLSENSAKMVKLEAHFNDRLDAEVAKRQQWGAWRLTILVTAINIILTIAIRLLFP